MARASTPTKLSLDEFAQIIGLNPLMFNGFSSQFFHNNTCGDVFFQYDWQHSDRIGRETIAQAIQAAEMEMEAEAGFFLMPTWITEERVDYPQPGMPGVFGMDGFNTRGMLKSIESKHALVISGGIREKTLLERSSAITRSDADGDGYNELCTVTTAVTFTDINEVRIYFTGYSGDDSYEIRPAKVAISGGFATITFKAWQVPLLISLERLDASALDGDDAANYETTVDVYRVRNDPSTQLQFMWENCGSDDSCCGSCIACQFGTQAGCFHSRDPRLGILVPAPGSWNANDLDFDSADWSVCRDPDQVRLWYYSGWKDDTVARPYVEMSSYWKFAVAVFAVSKFERAVCGCSNVNQFVEKWRRDASFESMNEGGFKVTAELMSNKLGTSMGALYAYKQIHRPGIRVIK
jgi:hypothetical protein